MIFVGLLDLWVVWNEFGKTLKMGVLLCKWMGLIIMCISFVEDLGEKGFEVRMKLNSK